MTSPKWMNFRKSKAFIPIFHRLFVRKSTVSHFAILKGWYFIISFAKKSANDHNKPKYGGNRQNQVEYLKSFDVNVWRGWYSWQDGECRARKGGINGYSLRHGRRLFSFQDRNWPSLSQKTFWYFEEFYQTKYFFDMFIGTLPWQQTVMFHQQPQSSWSESDTWRGLGASVARFHRPPISRH